MGSKYPGSQSETDEPVKQTLYIPALLILLLCPVILQAEEMTLEVIPLQHRMVDDVVPVLRPLLAPGGTVTGMNNQLIIKTTAANMAELKQVLQGLDRSPRRLLITVKQDIGEQLQSREHSVTGEYSSGDVTVRAGDKFPQHDGLSISATDDEGNVIRYRNRQSQADSSDMNTFTVQALEGHPAFIQAGQSVPVSNRTAVVTAGGVVVSEGTVYHEATSGFYVLPRLHGDQVTLLIAPRLTRTGPGKRPVFDVQNVETTARGRLGEWIELGGLDQHFSDSSRELLSSARARGQETRSVFVKVEEIK